MKKPLKIYTRTGDGGTTSLVGGKRVAKTHKRIEAYGTIDELICHIGLLRDGCRHKETADFLLTIQKNLMVCAALVACDMKKHRLPVLDKDAISTIEQKIDLISASLPAQKHFLIPGGHPVVSQCHICRTVCRRAERETLKAIPSNTQNKNILIYINRLSDYLYVLSRHLSVQQDVDEILWIS